jgi:two-component system chemotaxis response regulator CheY
MRFLVVDDSATMRRIIKNQLKVLGFEQVVEAQDAKAALDVLNSEDIDFLITDWAMPQMTGLQLVLKIRATRAGAKLPILMVTAIGREEEIHLAAEAGVNAYIIKPFEHTTLRQKIAQILAQKGGLKAASGTGGEGRAAGLPSRASLARP